MNILAYIVITSFVVLVIKLLKVEIPESQKILLLFFISSYLFNSFVYLHTELIARYYYPVLIVIFPCFAILLENAKISELKRYGFGTVLSILIFTSSFATVQHYFTTNPNKKLYKVADFINDKYDFGYATFWNANVISYLTNGKVEVGNAECKKNQSSQISEIADNYGYRKWLTPKRYYSNTYNNKPIFLLLQNDELEMIKDKKIISSGTQVYSDEFYTVYEYASHEAYKNSF